MLMAEKNLDEAAALTANVKQAETLLQIDALQRAIFNSANFSYIATDANGVIQLFNVGAERMLGYKAGEVINRITPADLSDPLEVIARAKALSVEFGTPITPGFEALVFKASRGIEDIYELTKLRKDGSRFPAVLSVTALRDAQNAIIGYLLIGTDNTARKRAEEELLKAGALQRAIFNSANFSSIATDAKGVIQIFNVGAERMLGYAAAEVMNRITPAFISDPQEVLARASALSLEFATPITPGFEALVFKASRGIEDIYELTYIRKDGSRFPAVVSITALRDAQNAIIGYLLIGTDNTARKRAEEELLKAGALQRAIFNSANFSSIATDARGVIQIFNVGAERMLGYTAADVMNKITPADISDPLEVIARAQALSVEFTTPIAPGFEALVFKASRGIEDIYELTYIRKDGSQFPAVVSVTALRDAQNTIIGYLLIGTDNTARQQAEQALLKAGALQKLNGEVQRATEMKSQFLASMSHELRTPLNAILGFSELLDEEARGPLNEQQRRFITHVRTASKHLLQLINDILDLSKIESGQVELQMECFPLVSALAEVRSITRPLTMTKKLRVVDQISPKHFVVGDRVRVKQILYNLMSNAIKFTPEGGEIRLTAERVGDYVSVSVSDTGVGISLEDTAIIFEEFRQVGDTTRGVKEGTGLGLAITRRLLEQQGGTIGVESTPGSGSPFTFRLPAGERGTATAMVDAVKEPVAEPEVPILEEIPEGDTRQNVVLVVDDDPAVVELHTEYLSNAGYRVVPATSGVEGVVKARGIHPDLITLDISMPGQSGWETLHAIKSDPATTEIPVVIVSVVEQKTLAMKLGAADCLVKPVSRHALLAVVRREAGHNRAQPRVLIVDDDAAEAELSAEVVRSVGARPEFASSAMEALRLIQQTRPDAVLLDLLMPEMDGFDVLRSIREDPALSDLPVYIITAKELNESEIQFLSARTQAIFRKTGAWKEDLQARMITALRRKEAVKETS